MEFGTDWTEKFISCIENRPAMFDKSLKDYSDKDLKTKLWSEVCEIMVPHWNMLTQEEKTIKGKEIQQRWQNLRTCFRRELNEQRKEKFGPPAKRRRKYMYFDQLRFLLPTLEDRRSENIQQRLSRGPESDVEESDNVDIKVEEDWSEHYSLPVSTIPEKRNIPCEQASPKVKDSYEIIDEDKYFLLSLLPSLRKLDDDQKLEAKIEMLQMIRRLLRARMYLEDDLS